MMKLLLKGKYHSASGSGAVHMEEGNSGFAEAASMHSKQTNPTAESSNARNILVVDDDPMMTKLLKINFELAGYVVEECNESTVVTEIVKVKIPNIIVLDIMMPIMDGWRILEILRKRSEMDTVPVIMVTAKVQDQDIRKSYSLGADGYVMKPFVAEDLIASVKKLLGMRKNELLERRNRLMEESR